MKGDPSIRRRHRMVGLTQHVLKRNQLYALGQQLMRHSVHFNKVLQVLQNTSH